MTRNEIDDYLLKEMSEQQRENLEDKIVGDNALFFEVAERENELVDLYASGNLNGDELSRFERALASNPARRQKVENARVLREFVSNERTESKTITIAERSGFLAGIGRMFSFGTPAFQFASIGLILILGLLTVFLLIDRRNTGTSNQLELESARQRASEIESRLKDEQDASGELAAELNSERDRIDQLQAEIGKLRQSNQNVSNGKPDRPVITIASLLLTPTAIRGGATATKRLEIGEGTTRVAVSVAFPPDAAAADTVSIKLDGETVGSDIRVRSRGGERVASITIAASKFKPGRHEITLVAPDGRPISTFPVMVAGP